MGADRRGASDAASGGMFWFMGWLFTIAFAKLGFWQAVWALLLWPYYLGITVR